MNPNPFGQFPSVRYIQIFHTHDHHSYITHIHLRILKKQLRFHDFHLRSSLLSTRFSNVTPKLKRERFLKIQSDWSNLTLIKGGLIFIFSQKASKDFTHTPVGALITELTPLHQEWLDFISHKIAIFSLS